MHCWVLSDGDKVGSYNQGLGLAKALGFSPELKKIYPRFPWSALPPRLWFSPLSAQSQRGDALTPPWPNVLITIGRAAAAPAREIRRLSGCYTICLMDPKLPRSAFDLFVVPEHDRLRGDNVLTILGPVHQLTRESLSQGAQNMMPQLAHLPRPFTTILLGGSSPHCEYSDTLMNQLISQICQIACEGGTLLITPSRRTPPEFIAQIHQQLSGFSHRIWDGEGENPYQGFLGVADRIFVTQDSISMTAEACFTGKPVYVLEIPLSTQKFNGYFDSLVNQNHARFFKDHTPFTPQILDEMTRILPEIKARLRSVGRGVNDSVRRRP